jgi:hypothetical protein
MYVYLHIYYTVPSTCLRHQDQAERWKLERLVLKLFFPLWFVEFAVRVLAHIYTGK